MPSTFTNLLVNPSLSLAGSQSGIGIITAAPSLVSNTISFGNGTKMLLEIRSDGFYVNGVRAPAGPKEAEVVYKAFKTFLRANGL